MYLYTKNTIRKLEFSRHEVAFYTDFFFVFFFIFFFFLPFLLLLFVRLWMYTILLAWIIAFMYFVQTASHTEILPIFPTLNRIARVKKKKEKLREWDERMGHKHIQYKMTKKNCLLKFCTFLIFFFFASLYLKMMNNDDMMLVAYVDIWNSKFIR